MSRKIDKSKKDWAAQLTPEQYRVTQEQATERPFSGKYVHRTLDGTYICVCCGAPLFSSDTQFDSGSGWPSFFAPLDSEQVETKTDSSWLMDRTEVHCASCGAHLGHIFDDGPNPTGLRYCINSVALNLAPKAEDDGESTAMTATNEQPTDS